LLLDRFEELRLDDVPRLELRFDRERTDRLLLLLEERDRTDFDFDEERLRGV